MGEKGTGGNNGKNNKHYGHLKSHMETYSILQKSKWSHQTMGKTISQLDTSCYQVKLPVLEMYTHVYITCMCNRLELEHAETLV